MKISHLLGAFIMLLAVVSCSTKDNADYDDWIGFVPKPEIEFPKESGEIRILSYNVRHFEDNNGTIDYDRAATLIKTLNADFVCLQEIDSVTNRSKKQDQMAEIAQRTGMQYAFSKSINYQGGGYGNGLLSMSAPSKTYKVALPGEEARSALVAEFAKYVVISTHFDHKNLENRVASVKAMTALANTYENKHVYMAGDLNDDDRANIFFKELTKDWNIDSSSKNTFPTGGAPKKCIDFIVSFKETNPESTKTDVIYELKAVNVSTISDHYPVFCDYKDTQVLTGKFAGGTGTESDPYQIATRKHLENIADTDWEAAALNRPYFKLIEDIDLTGKEWVPLNITNTCAQMHFDGDGHVIKNMKVSNTNYASFAGIIAGSIRNVGFVNADVTSNNGGGIIAGYVGIKGPKEDHLTGVIENCFTSGVIRGGDAVGGIAGNIGKKTANAESAVRNCFSTAQVISEGTGNRRAGGIVGINWEHGVVENCYATGEVSSQTAQAGGIAGHTDMTLVACAGRNTKVSSGETKNSVGRIAGVSSKKYEQKSCVGQQGIILDNGGTLVADGELNTEQDAEIAANKSYDGATKSKAYLSDPASYKNDLQWPVGSIWANKVNKDGLLLLDWLAKRADYEDLIK